MAIELTVEEEKKFEGQPKGFPFGDFDIADVMLPDGDDMGIPSEDEEEEEVIEAESGFGNIIGACSIYLSSWPASSDTPKFENVASCVELTVLLGVNAST